MDPTAIECRLYDSLKEPRPVYDETVLPTWYRAPRTALTTDIRTEPLADTPNLPAIYCDPELYQSLGDIKDTFSLPDGSEHPRFFEARNKTNPFEDLGNSIFINRAAIKLANIDAIYHLTGNLYGSFKRQSESPFIFCDVAAGPGGFTQYLQYRLINSNGYGMTLKDSPAQQAENERLPPHKRRSLDWNLNALDITSFQPLYGDDGTGNLYTNWDWFVKEVLAREAVGVDLVTADGGFDLEESASEGEDRREAFRRQEYLSSRLLVVQAIVGIALARERDSEGQGGNFVLKVFDCVTEVAAQTIFLLSCCFERIALFKPVSSRPANAERYLVCWSRLEEGIVSPYLSLLKEAARAYTDSDYVTSILRSGIRSGTLVSSLPEDFVSWLTSQNNLSIDRQIRFSTLINQYLYDNVPPYIEPYNLYKAFILWNLPDNREYYPSSRGGRGGSRGYQRGSQRGSRRGCRGGACHR